jgi:glycosyltransferase involved in cell wall biosynthesis
MKICFINNLYGELSRGGAEQTIRTLIKALEAKGHSCKVIEASKAYERLSSLPKWRRFLHHAFSWADIFSYWRLKQRLDKGAFDLLWSHNLTGFGLLAFRALGKTKKIHTMHDVQFLHPSGLMIFGQEKIFNSLVARAYQFICSRLFPKDALLIFPSRWLHDTYQRYLPLKQNRKLIIKNPLSESIELEKKPNDVFTFLYLGQIEEHKGIRMLLRAFSKLKGEARLKIVGDGSLLPELKANNKDSRIDFAGHCNQAKEYIKQADCMVIPSICYENLPTVALEAASLKTPVIGSRLGGIGEAIGDERLLFDVNEESCLEKLNFAFNNSQELKKIAETARQNLSVPKVDEYLSTVGKAVDLIF